MSQQPEAFLLMIGRRYVLMFVTKNRQNYIAMTKSQDGGVFEVCGKCFLRVMTPDPGI